MADTIAEAFVRVRPDTSGFQQEAQPGLFGSAVKLAAGIAAVFASKKLFDFGKSAVAEAALTQKAVENVRAQFGSLAPGVQKFADSAAAAFGISDQASLGFASTLAVTAKNIGLNSSQTATMNKGYQELAGSIASIKGIDPASVFDTLSSAMLGSTRGLKTLGISVNAQNEAQAALKLGIKGTSSEWTAAQKAQIIYAVATQHLTGFLDQAGKHSGDLIDVQHRLTAEWANAKDTIGNALLPIVQQFAGYLADNLPAAMRIAGQAIQIVVTALGQLTSVLTIVSTTADLVKQFIRLQQAGDSMGMTLQKVGVTALEDMGVSASNAKDAIALISGVVSRVAGAITGLLSPAVSGIRDTIKTLAGELGKIAGAPNLSVAIRIAFADIPKAVAGLFDGIRHALLGSTQTSLVTLPMGKVIGVDTKQSKGLVTEIGAALSAGFQAVPFADIGHKIGQAIGDAIRISNDAAKRLNGQIVAIVGSIISSLNSTDVTPIADFGLKIIATMFVRLLDPSFWIENWRLALDVAIAALSLAFAPAKFVDALRAIPFAKFLIDPLLKLGDFMKPAIETFFGAMFSAIRAAFPELSRAGEGIVVKLLEQLKLLPTRAGVFILDMAERMGKILGDLVGKVGRLAVRVVTAILRPYATIARNAGRFILDMARAIIDRLGSAAGEVLGPARRIGQGVIDGILSILRTAASKVKGMLDRIPAALGDLSRLLYNAGVKIMDGLLSGLEAGFHKVTSFVSSVASSISNLKGPLEYDRILLIPHGQAIMAGLHQGLSSGLKDNLSLAASVAGQIQRAVVPRSLLAPVVAGAVPVSASTPRPGGLLAPTPGAAFAGSADQSPLAALTRALSDVGKAVRDKRDVTITNAHFTTTAMSFDALRRDALDKAALRVRR